MQENGFFSLEKVEDIIIKGGSEVFLVLKMFNGDDKSENVSLFVGDEM